MRRSAPAPRLDNASDEQREAADVVRLSVGLESADDLIRDLDEALAGAG